MRTILAILAGAIAVSVIVSACSQSPTREISFGLAKSYRWNSNQHKAEAAATGLTDHYTVYYNVRSADNKRNPAAWLREHYLKEGQRLVVALILNGTKHSAIGKSEVSETAGGVPGNLHKIVAGEYDDDVLLFARAFAKASKAQGACSYYRLMYEADGNWFPWGMYANGNTPELFRAAWIRMVKLIRTVDPSACFELNLNRRDANGNVLKDWDRYFPGWQYVDAIAVSTYNRCKTSATIYQTSRSFTEEFEPIYQALDLVMPEGVPINIAETATTDFCGDKLDWYREQLTDIREKFPRVAMITFFLDQVPAGKASNDRVIRWDLTKDEKQRFKALIMVMRGLLRTIRL